jgi:hypothetical protein
LQIDAVSERKQSLVTDMVAKQEKVAELQQGKVSRATRYSSSVSGIESPSNWRPDAPL